MAGPLEGVRIIDLSRLAPGPYCSLLLADLGADVIKVEEPLTGDYMRTLFSPVKKESAFFISLNRNKRSVTVNMKTEAGKEIVKALARTSDALLEGFRPGVMDRLGLGYDEMKKVNPRLVYCSLSGYGQDGPYRNLSGHDLNYIALGGLLGLTGAEGGPPVIPGVPISDLVGGMMAALGILAALNARSRTGAGQWVDVAMMDTVVSLMGMYITRSFAEGQFPQRGREILTGMLPRYNVYETRDGRYMALGALEDKFWKGFCKAVGREDLAGTRAATEEERREIIEEVKKIFLEKDQAQWVKLFKDHDVCCTAVYDLPQVAQDPQVLARKMVLDVLHPREGSVKQAGIPVKFSETPGEIKGPSPAVGEHTEEILTELGFSAGQIREWREAGIV
ncbi:MAG: CoA transferase [Peptococcaceae bacterium]|nr:CoA transferase [Peptococcaceae bacterium]